MIVSPSMDHLALRSGPSVGDLQQLGSAALLPGVAEEAAALLGGEGGGVQRQRPPGLPR
jgi:hypothetical protein